MGCVTDYDCDDLPDDPHGHGPVTLATLAANGEQNSGVVFAHGPDERPAAPGPFPLRDRREQEDEQDARLSPGATRSWGAGDRLRPEAPDLLRTAFERDRDRVLHSPAFRRLAGKTQVYVLPDGDHTRTRMTHSLEVAQIAGGIARVCRLNTDLTEVIALAHDLGHGPCGHGSEKALSPYVPGGYDHATYGADVIAVPLNLCAPTLDGIRNHSWRRPAPLTPEGSVVSLADRIGYLCHDAEDAFRQGVIQPTDLPAEVRGLLGDTHREQVAVLVRAVVEAARDTGRIGLPPEHAEVLRIYKTFMYERVYLRPESVLQRDRAVAVLQALVELHIARPELVTDTDTDPDQDGAGGLTTVARAVRWVSGMTDRFAFRNAVELLDWDPATLPKGA